MARVWLSISFSCLLACTAGVDDAGEVCGTGAALVTNNRLSSNRLSSNRLATNRLSSNRLATNRLAQNRLAQNRLAQNRLAQNRLSSNGLSSTRLQLDQGAAADLVATEGGREVLRYAVECALPRGTTVVTTHDGSTYEFDGALGLAPEWLAQPLDAKGQRWISACLFARVNAAGVSVRISLRGPLGALDTDASEMATWGLEEGAFWGNVFGATDEPLDWNACRGLGQAAGETGDLADRDCTEPDPEHPGFTLCGFKYAGDCSDVCSRYEAEGTYYTACAGPEAPGEVRADEVITTFAAALGASCE